MYPANFESDIYSCPTESIINENVKELQIHYPVHKPFFLPNVYNYKATQPRELTAKHRNPVNITARQRKKGNIRKKLRNKKITIMKKKILLMAIALLGLTGISASAQQTQNEPTRRESPAGENNKMRQPREFTEFAFEGVLLDINQQQRIDSLNAAVKAKRPAKPVATCCPADSTKKAECKSSDCKKAQCDNATASCKNDKRADADRRGKTPKGQRMMRNNPYGDEYVAKVKEILTPEQFEIFQENLTQMPPMARQKAAPTMKDGSRKGQAQMSKAKKMKADRRKADSSK